MIAIELTGQVVVVTGATGNIGGAIAERFAVAGATVVRHGRRAPSPVGGQPSDDAERATPGCVDVTGDLVVDGPDPLVVVALDAYGRIDAVVNAAGVQTVAELATVDLEQWQDMLELNVTAAHRLTQRFARHVGERGGVGAVVHVASIEATRPAVGHGHYAVAKAALVMHARAAALELGPLGVRVNSVSPGLIERPEIAEQWREGVDRWRAAAPLGRLGTGTDVADACVFLCSPLASWITGIDLVVDGGVSARPGW